MSDEAKSSLGMPLIISILFHALFLSLLLGNWLPSGSLLQKPSVVASKPQPQKITQATTVNKEDLDKELARLANLDKAEANAREKQKLQALNLKKQRIAEERRLKKLKQVQAKELKRNAALLKAKAKKLAEIEKKQKLALKKQKESEQKAAAAEKARETAEKKRIAAEKEQALLKKQQELKEKAALEKASALKRQAKLKLEAARREKNISSQIQSFGFRVRQKIAQNWLVQGRKDGASCVLTVQLAPGGMVLDVLIQNSSGDPAFDRSAIAAVYKSSPLPVPSDPEAFERMRELRLTLRPDDVLTTG